jgi:hypothetical protein
MVMMRIVCSVFLRHLTFAGHMLMMTSTLNPVHCCNNFLPSWIASDCGLTARSLVPGRTTWHFRQSVVMGSEVALRKHQSCSLLTSVLK